MTQEPELVGRYQEPKLAGSPGYGVWRIPSLLSPVRGMHLYSPEGMEKKKAWKDIWGCGQGINAIKTVHTTAGLVDRLKQEYIDAQKRVLAA